MKDNELIAEFMGIPQMNDYKGVMWDIERTGEQIYSVRPDELRYHSSWDWLMPVVQKIYALYDEFNFTTIDQENRFLNVLDLYVRYPISTTYHAVVEFIKWHNQQKP